VRGDRCGRLPRDAFDPQHEHDPTLMWRDMSHPAILSPSRVAFDARVRHPIVAITP
jgi:hypothetical protein